MEHLLALDPHLPPPPASERLCGECGRLCEKPNDATLFHFDGNEVPLFTGVPMEPFSRWLYRCQWCRGKDTQQQPVPDLHDELWAFINTMEDDVVPPYVKSCVPKTKNEMRLARILITKRLARWVSRWPLEDDALYLTEKGYERMGWDARFVVSED